MHRPKSSWAEIVGAVGALAAAEGANQAAQEVRSLRHSQQESFALLKDQLERERQRLESVRKLRQSVFDFSEALLNFRREIKGLLPDYYCAAALFSEMELQSRVDTLYADRESLESYEDKKLLKNCSEWVTSIRASIEECASADGISIDEVTATLSSRHSEIGRWRQLLAVAREQVEQLSRSIADWGGTGPNEFLHAFESLRARVTGAQAALKLLGESLQRFQGTFGFVYSHPSICHVWSDACDARPKTAEDIFSQANELFVRADQLLSKWGGQIADFKALWDSFYEARYEDFLQRLEKCSADLRHLPEVCAWADTASTRLQRVSKLLKVARDEIARRNWLSALVQLREARNVPCSGRLYPELKRLRVAASDGLLAVRLTWFVIIGITAGLLSYSLEIHHWTSWGLGISPVFLVVLLSPQIIAARKAGASWREILKGLIDFIVHPKRVLIFPLMLCVGTAVIVETNRNEPTHLVPIVKGPDYNEVARPSTMSARVPEMGRNADEVATRKLDKATVEQQKRIELPSAIEKSPSFDDAGQGWNKGMQRVDGGPSGATGNVVRPASDTSPELQFGRGSRLMIHVTVLERQADGGFDFRGTLLPPIPTVGAVPLDETVGVAGVETPSKNGRISVSLKSFVVGTKTYELKATGGAAGTGPGLELSTGRTLEMWFEDTSIYRQ